MYINMYLYIWVLGFLCQKFTFCVEVIFLKLNVIHIFENAYTSLGELGIINSVLDLIVSNERFEICWFSKL